MLFTSWQNEKTNLIGNSPSYQECFLLKDKIDKQMGQYAICSEDQLHNTDYTDDQFDSIAPKIQNVELWAIRFTA